MITQDRYEVNEMLGNFSKVVFTSDCIDSCAEYVEDCARAYALAEVGNGDLFDEEMELQLSYFSIDDSEEVA